LSWQNLFFCKQFIYSCFFEGNSLVFKNIFKIFLFFERVIFMIYHPRIYTVESVTSGHPDKICDQISDAVLDACLQEDPLSRVAVETLGAHGLLVVAGEVTTQSKVDFESIARSVYQDIGYEDTLKVLVNIVTQSQDIAEGVNHGGAGDQGIMYGFATNENDVFLPQGIVLVHTFTRQLEMLRKTGLIPWLRPDGKAQVTFEDGHVRTILVSAQHAPDISQEEVRAVLIEKLIQPLVDKEFSQKEILINPTGRFVQGGFEADTGVTGRKLMVDTYGGLIPHGGGCFSGKDPSKVDRSAAYMCRFAAKNIVANGFAKECLVAVSYAIGRSEPLMITGWNEEGTDLNGFIKKHFDFRPEAIIERLNLRVPIYRKTATYGHFGDSQFPWEQIISL